MTSWKLILKITTMSVTLKEDIQDTEFDQLLFPTFIHTDDKISVKVRFYSDKLCEIEENGKKIMSIVEPDVTGQSLGFTGPNGGLFTLDKNYTKDTYWKYYPEESNYYGIVLLPHHI